MRSAAATDTIEEKTTYNHQYHDHQQHLEKDVKQIGLFVKVYQRRILVIAEEEKEEKIQNETQGTSPVLRCDDSPLRR